MKWRTNNQLIKFLYFLLQKFFKIFSYINRFKQSYRFRFKLFKKDKIYKYWKANRIIGKPIKVTSMEKDKVVEKFMKTYSNLPLKLRKEIVVVVDGEPITWKVAHQEIKQNTKKGEKILEKLGKIIFVDEK